MNSVTGHRASLADVIALSALAASAFEVAFGADCEREDLAAHRQSAHGRGVAGPLTREAVAVAQGLGGLHLWERERHAAARLRFVPARHRPADVACSARTLGAMVGSQAIPPAAIGRRSFP